MKNLFILLFLSTPFLWAQAPIDMDVLVTYQHETFTIESMDKATHTVSAKMTIMNEDGQKKLGVIVIGYDKFRKIKKLETTIMDAVGTVVQRSLKSEDTRDFSASDGISLANDDRVRVAFPRHSQFPYILEYRYEIALDGFLSIPRWFPLDPQASVEYSSFTVIAPKDFNLRYATRNMNVQPVITDVTSFKKSYAWEVKNLPPIKVEPFMPPASTLLPHLVVGADEFQYGGVMGKSATWRQFGQWYLKLSENRQTLSSSKVAFLQDLVKDAKTDVEKAKLVYNHLQETTRYILVTLGLGGFQPFPASYVEGNQYGDCKALSNYLMAMLNAVGVKAYPALINAGADAAEIIEEVPVTQFNHAIVALPQPDNSYIWLEATSQTQNFGHTGDFTNDRMALVITPDGGVLARTSGTDVAQNESVLQGVATIDAMGKVRFEIARIRKGSTKDNAKSAYASIADVDRKKRLLESFDFAAPTLISADFSDLENRDDTYTLKYVVEAARYANKTGVRLFLKPNAFSKTSTLPENGTPRKYNFDFGYPETRIDSLLYKLPEGFVVEALPQPVKISTPFVEYEASIIKNTDGTLLYTRKYIQKVQKIEAKFAPDLTGFYRQAAQADQMMVVLKKL